MEYLRDELWQFIGAVFAFIAIIVSVIIFLFQRTRKEISYQFFTVKMIEAGFSEYIKIRYKNTLLKEIHSSSITIANTGNIPITANDFHDNVVIEFRKNIFILGAKIVQTHPEGIDVKLDVSDNQIVIEKTLLNDGDRIVVGVLSKEPIDRKDLLIKARVAGVKIIELQSDSKPSVFISAAIVLILIAIGSFFISISLNSSLDFSLSTLIVFILGIIFIVLAGIVAGIILSLYLLETSAILTRKHRS